MSRRTTMSSSGRADREGSHRDADEPEIFANPEPVGTGRSKPKLTRVQIEALVSGEFAPMSLGPELVHRLNRAWSGSGQRLHMLHVQVVKTPLACPRCGDRALYRAERRGLMQRKVYPWLGMFPWKCASCRQSTLLRLRSAEHAFAEVAAPAEAEPRKAA